MGILTLCGGFMAMQFEQRGDTYLYRVNGKGRAWPATEAEYRGFVRHAGVAFLLGVAAMGLSIVAAAMLISLWFPQGDEAGGMVLLVIALLLIGFGIYRAQYRVMRAPERALAGRAPVDAPPATVKSRARAVRSVAKRQPTGGTLAYFGYVLAEIVGGVAALVLGFKLLEGRGEVIAIVGGLIAAGIVMLLIDRQCERHTGSGALEWLPTLP